MTNEDILLVQLSWRKVLPIKDRFAELFYLKLFEMDPAIAHAVHRRPGATGREADADDHGGGARRWTSSMCCCR